MGRLRHGAGCGGEAEAVLRVGVGRDDLCGELRLEGIGRVERRDGGHRGLGAVGAGIGRIGGWRREEAAEGGEDLAGDGGWGSGRVCMALPPWVGGENGRGGC